MFYIIGSGPSGVSAAIPLLKKGYEVTMLDSGLDLEPERAKVVKRMKKMNKNQWTVESIRTIKENMNGTFKGVDKKFVYGSDFPYYGVNHYQPIKLVNAKMLRSLAKGGFSNVWGAGIFPVMERDIGNWPVSYQELKDNYQSVLSFMPHAGDEESGDEGTIYGSGRQDFKKCAQVLSFLADLRDNQNALHTEGISYHIPRLAVDFKKQVGRPGCVYCGLCLYGCPYGLVYSSSGTVNKMIESYSRFHYVKNILVERIEEQNKTVKIFARRLFGSEKIIFSATRVFIATGPVSTARIMLRSLEAYDRPLIIRHSDQFQIPFIRYRSEKNVVREELHTLNQLSIQIFDKQICKDTVLLQMFAYNDLYLNVLKRIAGPLAPFLNIPIENMLGRLLMFKVYLHSDVSSHITAILEKGDEGPFILEGHEEPETKKIAKNVVSKLNKNKKYLKGFTFPLLMRKGIPGTGNHSGCSFPMKKKPSEFESDLLGRPYGFNKVHIVDSTVLPTIPASTITFTIMANAHRIAKEC
jgi:choline dehydrogenase-like flavoprotein